MLVLANTPRYSSGIGDRLHRPNLSYFSDTDASLRLKNPTRSVAKHVWGEEIGRYGELGVGETLIMKGSFVLD